MTSSSEFKQHQQDETCWQPFCQRLPVSLSLRTPSSVGVGQHCGRQFRSSQYDKAERSPREETRGSTLQPLPRRTNILHGCGVYDDSKPAIKWYDATTHKSKARSPTDKYERNYKLITSPGRRKLGYVWTQNHLHGLKRQYQGPVRGTPTQTVTNNQEHHHHPWLSRRYAS